jgi:hypothetical protein
MMNTMQLNVRFAEKGPVDLHHIQARGMGGSKHRDGIENIMALCRPCHMNFTAIRNNTKIF